jgi:hypothetical protein
MTGTGNKVFAVISQDSDTRYGLIDSPLTLDPIYDYDVGIAHHDWPDTCFVGDSIRIGGVVKNFGQVFVLSFLIIFQLDSIYHQTLNVIGLQPDSTRGFYFLTLWVNEPGTFSFFCSTALAGDQNHANDGGWWTIVVLPRQGLEEKIVSPVDIRQNGMLNTTLMTVAQFKSQVLHSKFNPEIYAPTGRRLTPDKIRKGIYLVKTGSMKKIIILD